MSDMIKVELTVNGEPVVAEVEPRTLLADLLRGRLRLTGTHLGCEHGVCGACTVLIDGVAARSCLAFAVQAAGSEITTVEGLAGNGEPLGEVQEAFHREHALQCGFCTPGLVMTVHALLRERPDPTEEEILDSLSGNLCRCTGYRNIIAAVRRAAAGRAASSPATS